MPKKTTYSFKVNVEADPKTEQRFFRKLAHEMVEQILKKPRKGGSYGYSLENQQRKDRRRPYSRGPTVNRSKELDFSMAEVRKRETRKLVRRLAEERGIAMREMAIQASASDFSGNGLYALLKHHKGSPFRAISEGFPELKLMPWHMKTTPMDFWTRKRNRIAAIKWVLDKTGKDARQLTAADIQAHGMRGILVGRTIRSLLTEAGLVHSVAASIRHSNGRSFDGSKAYPWELNKTPKGAFKDKGFRIAAIRWVLWKSGKRPEDILPSDFQKLRVHNLFKHCGHKVINALVEAGFVIPMDEALKHAKAMRFKEHGTYPWHLMTTSRCISGTSDYRIAATRWLVWKTVKRPEELTISDFEDNKVERVLNGKSIWETLADAGFAFTQAEILAHSRRGRFRDTKLYPWQIGGRTSPGFYKKKVNRVAAVRWLIHRTGKRPDEIIQDDFIDNGLRGILPYFKGGRGTYRRALQEAGFNV